MPTNKDREVKHVAHRTILNILDKAIADNRANLADGMASDYPAYKEVVGYIKGLVDARDMVNEGFDKYMDEQF